MTKRTNLLITIFILLITLLITFWSGKIFYDFAHYDTSFVVRQDVITRIEKFSDYSPGLKGTLGDSNIYVIEGSSPGPSILIIGGTHPNEPSGQLTSTIFLENVLVDKGTVYIITEANRSAFTHSHPQEGSLMYYQIETPNGERTFKFGSRATNMINQWPNPDIYVHPTSGQKLSNNDTRNLNRAYPGSEKGTYTEKVAYAITQCIIKNEITITIDLHEASPEYLTINAIIHHNNEIATSIAAQAFITMELNDVEINVETSPVNLHGLSHRELGDYTDTLVFLCETSNASQGKFRGAFTEDLILQGKDKFYEKADQLGLLYASPTNINERVARHTFAIMAIIDGYNKKMKTNELGELIITNIPSYNDILTNGIGHYLLKVEK